MLFGKNTVTGTPTSTLRSFNEERALYVTLRLADGSPLTLQVYGELADQIETSLIQKKQAGAKGVLLTLEYNPDTGEVINFSIVTS